MTEPSLDVIMGERRKLLNVAYRLLGSLAEAEDAVQETYTRWYAMSPAQRAAVVSPGAWLTTVTSRICLDVLGSARARRERYVGEWLPEPVPDRDDDPADRITLDESITMAFLVVLESMTPAERVAFVLHDVFRYPFPEVAEIVGRTPAACRQLATSARRRIRAARVPAPPAADRAAIVADFRRAWAAGDVAGLIRVLDPAATGVADGGGRVTAALRPITGGERIARQLVTFIGRVPGLSFDERTVNGQPGLVVRRDGALVMVVSVEVTGDRITRLWTVVNPDKLRPWVR